MTALLAAVLAASSAWPTADPAAAPQELQRLYAVSSRALVQVGDDAGHAGTVLSDSGIIATSAYGLAGRPSVAITFTNGFRASADVVAIDEKLGVALLRATGLPPMAYLPLATAPVQQGQAAYAAQFRAPLQPSVTFARVASARVSRDGRIDDRVFTAPFGLRAVSGGPVLSYGGDVIGILVVNGLAFGYALNARELLAFVGAHADALPPSQFAISSDPSGAEVRLDDKPVGHTPMALVVPAGEHLLALRSPGLPDALRRAVALGPSRHELSETLFPGAPVHIAVPSGARVYLDGLLRALGPSTLWVPEGQHLVQATLSGFRPYTREIEVVAGRPLALEVALAEQHATLSVSSNPPGADVLLDDNRIGQTPLENAKVTPGVYALTVAKPGFHASTRPVQIADGQDVKLGTLTLEPPHLTLMVHAPPGTEIAVDGAPRQPLRPSMKAAPGKHQAVLYAPYQYAVLADFHGEDGEKVELSPVFVAAGDPNGRQVPHVLAGIMKGGAGVLGLVATGFFIAAESDREGHDGGLSPSGHGQLSTGLLTGGLGLGVWAASLLVDSLQPTPTMGFSRTAAGVPVRH